MLEAIIAFMPIKEDHVAIGSIDCSKEMRKNFATSSQSFKCDICGNISDILKPRVVSNDKKEEDVKSKQGEDVKEKSDNNNGNKDDKKDSGKDDIKEVIEVKEAILSHLRVCPVMEGNGTLKERAAAHLAQKGREDF